jgi:hypothetical protein
VGEGVRAEAREQGLVRVGLGGGSEPEGNVGELGEECFEVEAGVVGAATGGRYLPEPEGGGLRQARGRLKAVSAGEVKFVELGGGEGGDGGAIF